MSTSSASGGTLRSRQKQVARELILQAAADEIAEQGTEGVSLQAVADRAGVSKRTLYNYFDSRETLFSEICAWSDTRTVEMGATLGPEGLDSLPDIIPALWRSWEAQGTVYQAVIAIAAAQLDTPATRGRQERREAFVRAVNDLRPDLSAADTAALAAMFHTLGSAAVFQRLVIEDDIDVERGSTVVSWVTTLIRDALANGDNPFATPTTGGPA